MSTSVVVEDTESLSLQRNDGAISWMASISLHLAVAFIVAFSFYVANRLRADDIASAEPIVMPDAIVDSAVPGGVPHPGAGENPLRDPAQDFWHTASKGWASRMNSTDVPEFSAKSSAGTLLPGPHGGPAEIGGPGSGSLAPYGTPGGGPGAGPSATFIGERGNAYRIVYIIDHSGSMVEKLDFVKEEVRASVGALSPLQSFNVIAFSETAKLLGPNSLLRGNLDNKKLICDNLSDIRASGENDHLFDPFADAFRKAFALKPQLIFFLTDGAFDPRLLPYLARLNADHRVKINTIAYNTGSDSEDSTFASQLRQIARDHGGIYKFVSE